MKISVGHLKVIVSRAWICRHFALSLKSNFSHSPPPRPPSTGDTLLAIRAPIGTQLEVPIPESVSDVCTGFSSVLSGPVVVSLISPTVRVCRFSMDSENTRSVLKVHLVPLKFYWSIKTPPVPLPLFCPFLLQMTSYRTSQLQHLPPRCPLPPHRSTQISFSLCLVSLKCQ